LTTRGGAAAIDSICPAGGNGVLGDRPSTAALPDCSESCDHAAVVVGVDGSCVYLNDPYFVSAPQQVSHSDFLLAWSPNACTGTIVQALSLTETFHDASPCLSGCILCDMTSVATSTRTTTPIVVNAYRLFCLLR
jgi:hypothetical protein